MSKVAPSKSPRIPRSRRLALYVIALGTWLTGGLWLLFHYFFFRQGEFGPQPSALEPWWLKLHGAFAFGAIWIFGLLWGIHITAAWPSGRRRWSGGIMSGAFLLLTASGYLLYYAGSETARPVISAVHWMVGLLSPLLFFWHRFHFRRWRGARRAQQSRGARGAREEAVSR